MSARRPPDPMPDLMTVKEVADYLRLGERKIYDLVARRSIPVVKVTGKLLFPRAHIDLWLTAHLQQPEDVVLPQPRPPVISGSDDLLLEWAVRQSGCKLALLLDGSGVGLRRFAEGGAVACGLHLLDEASGRFNTPLVERSLAGVPYVLLHWARRETGLVLPQGNPQGIRGLADLLRPEVTFADRPPGTGAHLLVRALLRRDGLDPQALRPAEAAAVSETDVAAAILERRATAGFAVRAAANRFGLTFVPLAWEDFDLVLDRRAVFEPPLQALLHFTRTAAFAERARLFGGYDLTDLGAVRSNGA
ncbi:helix-turn-helix transcriptional regulator [Caenispirillum bisanense]|uniref:helix-turn-helix transcriptional regulator n=1 Tax=Caenispirillum bisanense TaxID=414052 RepID=UPI0031E15DA5